MLHSLENLMDAVAMAVTVLGETKSVIILVWFGFFILVIFSQTNGSIQDYIVFL